MSQEEMADAEGSASDSTKGNNKFNNKSKEYYLKNIPFSDSAMLASKDMVYEALFNIGRIYKDKLEDYPEAVKSFENLINRTKESAFTLSTYYYLYQTNMLMENKERAEYYKNLIIKDFPDSQYAKMLTDPDYIIKLEASKRQVAEFYERTYKAFLARDYKTVADNCKKAETDFRDHELRPKFALLKALTVGKVTDIPTFKVALTSVIDSFPEAPEKTAAEEMLAYISNVKIDSLQQHLAALKFENQHKGDSSLTFNEYNTNNNNNTTNENLSAADQMLADAEKMYELKKNDKHFYVVIVNKEELDVNRIRFNISSFNVEVFSFIDFEVSQPIILNDDLQMITVKSFKDLKESMAYFRHISVSPTVYGEVGKNMYQHFVISAKNFPVFYKDKEVEKYVRYFTKHYLEE